MAVSEGGQCPRTVDRIDRAWLEGEGTLAIRARDDAATAKAALDAFLADVSPTHREKLRVHIAAIVAQATGELTKAARRAASAAADPVTTGDAVLYARKYRIRWRGKSRVAEPTQTQKKPRKPRESRGSRESRESREPREARVGLFLVRPCLRSCTSAVFRIPAYKFVAAGGAESAIAPRYTVKSKVAVVACACDDGSVCDACMCRNQLRRNQAGAAQTDTQMKKRWTCQCCKHLFCLDDAHAEKRSQSTPIGSAQEPEMRNARYVAKAECPYCVTARGCRRSRSQTNGHVITTTQARASQSAPYATLRAGVFFHPRSNTDMKEKLLGEYGGQQTNPRSQVAAVRAEQGTSQRNSQGAPQGTSQAQDDNGESLGESQGESHGASLERADDGAAAAAAAAADQNSESGSGPRAEFAPEQFPVIELVGPRARRVSPRTPKTGRTAFV